MKKLTLTLLASAALAMPAVIPAMAQNAPKTQQPQAQQQNMQKPEAKNMQQPQAQQQNMQQSNKQQASEQNQGQNQQQASNQTVSPKELGRNGVRQVQQALNKEGFHAGRADGIFGPDTKTALKDFQKSKGIQSNGQLSQKTLSDLGVNVASNENTGNQNGNQSESSAQQPSQNQQ